MPKKILEGQIVSNKMINTVVVKVETTKAHPKYRKRYTASKKYKADTACLPAGMAGNVFNVGDKVLIEESRPLSKDKRWVIKSKI